MGDDFRMGPESCRWISMQTMAPLYLTCGTSQTMKSLRSISDELQCKARQNLISISKMKIF